MLLEVDSFLLFVNVQIENIVFSSLTTNIDTPFLSLLFDSAHFSIAHL